MSGEKSTKKQENIKGAKAKTKPASPSEARLQKRANDEKIIKRIKVIFAVVIIAAVIGTMAGIFLAVQKPTVAWFGNEKVTLPEFSYFLSQAKSALSSSEDFTEPGSEESFWLSNVSGTPLIELAKENALTNAQETKVCVAMANEQRLKLDSEDTEYVKSLINNMIESSGGDRVAASAGTKSTYGASLNELKKIIEQMLLVEKLKSSYMEGIEVTEGEARSTYDENINDYEKATVRHILFMLEGTEENPRTREESEALANDTLQRIRNGEDFATLVPELTEDPGSIETGGEYTLSRNEGYAQQFTDWSFSANIGDTAVVETDFGFHVMKLENKVITPFEEARENIDNSIKSERLLAQVDQWVADPKYEKRVNDSVYQGISWKLPA